LKARFTQSLARPLDIGQQRNFNNHYNVDAYEWRDANTDTKCSNSVVVSESWGDGAVIKEIEFNIWREIELPHESLLSTKNVGSIDD
jgi:hypothetical protein